ncbi:hypothetical protein GCM10023238_05370 [Streptomyces heliomycini]
MTVIESWGPPFADGWENWRPDPRDGTVTATGLGPHSGACVLVRPLLAPRQKRRIVLRRVRGSNHRNAHQA